MQSGESIYNLIPQPIMVPPKSPMHKSQHPGQVNPSNFNIGVNKKRTKATFGPAEGTMKPAPTGYLKKHTGEPVLPDPAAPTLPKSKVKDTVPKRDDKPVYGLISGKNFVTANAVENILSQPKKVVKEEPRATQKTDFGKVPKYLKTIKGQIETEKQMIAEYHRMQQEETMSGSMRAMTNAESEDLIQELKQKWQKVNEAYQKLPFTLDTPMRKIRKETYEAELTQLEKDIKTLDKKNILVVEED